MNTKPLSTLAALLCLSLPAAAVTYRWVDVTINPNVGAMTGAIVIDPAYWSPGAPLTDWYGGGNGKKQMLGMESFFLAGANVGFTVEYRSSAPPSYGTYGFAISLSDPNMVGSMLRFNSGNDSTSMLPADGSTWVVDNFSSDSVSVCYVNTGEACRGQIGQWVLDASTLPVPEPATWLMAMLGLGVLGVRRFGTKER